MTQGNDPSSPDAPLDTESILSRYRRVFEIAALGLAGATAILVVSAIGQAYAATQFETKPSTGFGDKVTYLAALLSNSFVGVIALICVALCVALRVAWPDERSQDRTVVPVTIALIVSALVLAASVYDIVATITGDSNTFGGSGSARFAQVMQDLATCLFAGITLWTGNVLSDIKGRRAVGVAGDAGPDSSGSSSGSGFDSGSNSGPESPKPDETSQ